MSINTQTAALRVLLSLTTILSAGTVVPAFAQSLSSPTPVSPLVDQNGVDIGSGRYIAASKAISIGNVAFNNVWNGTVDETTFNDLVFDNGFSAIVFLNGNSYRFNGNGSNADQAFTPVVPDGSTLIKAADGHVAYTAADGTKFEFTPVLAGTIGMRQSSGATIGSTARLEKSTKTNGETQTYHYRTETVSQNCASTGRFGLTDPNCTQTTYQRVQSVTSNTGAMLKASYASQTPGPDFNKLVGVKAINLSQDYCNPDADVCSGLTRTWPELQVVQTTDASGNIQKSFQSPDSGYLATTTGSGLSSINLDGVGRPNIQISNYPDNRVYQLTVNGKTVTYNYVTSGANETVTVTNADGKSTSYHTVQSGDSIVRIESKVDGLGNTTRFEYDSAGHLYKTVNPEGDATTLGFDPIGRVTETRQSAKPSAPAADVVTRASYVANCTVNSLKYCLKPIWTEDARGNRTDFTYSADHAELTRVQAPAPAAGQPRPTTDYGYTPLFAKIRDAGGNLVNAESPVWKLTSIRQCATAATCAGSSAETRTDVEYGTGIGGLNLLPTRVTVSAGDGSVSSTQLYAYDASDNLVSIDGALPGDADTQFFQWNSDKQLTGVIGPDPDGAGPRPRRAVRYTYTAGKLTQTDMGTVTQTGADAFNSFSVAQAKYSSYDAWDYLVQDTLAAGGATQSVTQYSYDSLGRPECTAVRMNPAAFGSLPGSACDLGAPGGYGPDRISRITGYDANDRATQVTSAFGTPEASTERTSYTANGKTQSVTDATTTPRRTAMTVSTGLPRRPTLAAAMSSWATTPTAT